MTSKTFSVRSNAVRNARSILGKDAKQGVHFIVLGEKPNYVWAAREDAAVVAATVVETPVIPSVKAVRAKVAKRPAKVAKKVGRKAGRKALTTVAGVTGKRLKMFNLISSVKGASLNTLTNVLGWQKHTVRGAISTIGSQFKVKVKSYKDERRGRVYQVTGRVAA